MQTVIKNPNWWRRRTTLERYLTLVSAFTCVAVIALVSGLVFVLLTNKMAEELVTTTPANNALGLHGCKAIATQNKVPEDFKSKGVCNSTECIHTASAVLNKLKLEVEPCDDFYQFACGNYIDETQIPEDEVEVDTFSFISDKLDEQLKYIITEERAETEPYHFKLPNLIYKACMNKSLIESLGTKPIKQISDSLGGWPVIVGDSWDSDKTWSWQETIKQFRRLGFSTNYIIHFSSSVDLKNSTKRILDLDQASIGISREYLVKGFNETLVSAYYDYMVDIAVFFGAEEEIAKKELLESLHFEMELANISLPKEKRRNANDLYNIRTIKQLQESYNYVQWLDYINALLTENLNVGEDEVINLSVPSFLEDLGKLLQRTNNRVIANYMMWRIHSSSIFYMPEKFRNRQLEYATAFSGKQERTARWKECVGVSRSRSDTDEEILGFSLPLGSLYVRKHFKQNSKVIALEMVNNIRAVFSQILDTVDWMDPKTKEEAQKKLHSMVAHIGYPEELLDNDKLAEQYANVTFDPDKYFESVLSLSVEAMDFWYDKHFREPFNKTDWLRHARPAVVNAFYSSIENSIQFPAGILQGHFFNAERPKYMNYGAIGYVIGHEITHGFDDQGRQFNIEGNLVDWWEPDTQKAFLEKTKCIIEQYGNYTDKQTGLNLNGINTQGENIADNGGVKQAYIAYNQWVAKNGEEPRLPGLEYTPNQMFWIAAAQTWCSKYRTEALKLQITTGSHPPHKYRVLGPLSNTKEFSRDFQCPDGTPMNPLQKCEVW